MLPSHIVAAAPSPLLPPLILQLVRQGAETSCAQDHRSKINSSLSFELGAGSVVKCVGSPWSPVGSPPLASPIRLHLRLTGFPPRLHLRDHTAAEAHPRHRCAAIDCQGQHQRCFADLLHARRPPALPTG
uniref:Uncharacterized protein n=1 Tax=Oryza barthii TaxID=65489 RepID=A0A0D3HV29_9ORYZ